MKRYIKSATSLGRFDKYYELISDAEVDDIYGEGSSESICEDTPGYNVNHLAWYVAKDQYIDALADNGLDLVELITEGQNTHQFLAYVVGGRVYPLDINEVERCCDRCNN